jgi:glycosyltransferase involved in cell wall biosynthesis
MNNPHPLISIILPAYREEENISLIYHELTNILQTLASQYRYEIIYVNDWSPDGTWREIDTLCQSDSHVKWVDLSRNFGKELALTAGIEAAQWDAIITLDVDGQHPVEHIPEFIGVIWYRL